MTNNDDRSKRSGSLAGNLSVIACPRQFGLMENCTRVLLCLNQSESRLLGKDRLEVQSQSRIGDWDHSGTRVRVSSGSGQDVNKHKCTTRVTLVLSLALLNTGASGQEPKAPLKHFSFEIGVKFSTLGAGIEAAVPVTYHSNLRFGFNAFNYSLDEKQDGILYSGEISFRSVQATYDWFPSSGSFHLSPGLMVYDGNRVTAKASVPAGQLFTLQNTNYVSDPTNPVHGNASVDFFKVNPMMLAGWRNLIPRMGRFGIPFEFGIIYDGTPRTFLELSGGACDPTGANCRNISTDPTIQSNMQLVRDRFKRKVSPFKVYPVVSVGLSVDF